MFVRGKIDLVVRVVGPKVSLRLLHYSDIENAYDVPERIGSLAGTIAALRDRETIVCGTGDNTGPGVLSLTTRGQQSLDFFTAIRPDAEAFGNHDFDYGVEAVRRLVRQSPQPWLAANIYADGERFGAADGVRPSVIVDAGPHRVGLVGVTTPDTVEMAPVSAELDFTDPVDGVATQIDRLRDDTDYLVVLSHCGDDGELARLEGVDAVVGGHKHEAVIERVDGTLLTRPGGNGTHVVELDFADGQPTATRHSVADGPRDEAVAQALRERMDQTGLTDTVATVDEPLVLDRRARLGGESRAGNFVADALRWRTDAQVALVRAGLRETDPLSGTVTAADLVGVLPFDNDLHVIELSGDRLLEAFRELSVTYRYPDVDDWWFGHLSGGSVVWDEGTDELVEARVGGDPVDPDGTYTVAVDEHHVASSHLFSCFTGADVVRTEGKAYDALVEYARARGIRPKLEGRIERQGFDPSTTVTR